MRAYLTVGLAMVLLAVPVFSGISGELVDVNTPSSLQLQKLYRVGFALASRIIAEREENGPYRSLSDLADRVRGIGPKTIARWEGVAVAIVP